MLPVWVARAVAANSMIMTHIFQNKRFINACLILGALVVALILPPLWLIIIDVGNLNEIIKTTAAQFIIFGIALSVGSDVSTIIRNFAESLLFLLPNWLFIYAFFLFVGKLWGLYWKK